MKLSSIRTNPYMIKPRAMSILVIALFLFMAPGISLGSSESSSQGEHGEASGPKGWVATDTYRVMNFIVLAVGLFILLRKPISQALNSRIKGIQDQLKDLEEEKKKAEAQLADYNERLFLLDKEAEKIVVEYIRQGNEAKAKILKAAEAAAGKIEAQACRNIEHEFKTAKEKLQVEVLEKALAKAEDMIKRKITTEDQNRLVDEYIDKVVMQ